MNSYQKALKQRREQHLLRHFPLPPEGIDFYSNDYLGLAQSKDLYEAIAEEHKNLPTNNGSTGSRLLSGNSHYAEQVEKDIAAFHHAEAALVYTSGYTANLGLVSSLATKDATLICDELIHASLIDGARLGKSNRLRFRHNDLQDLESNLQKVKGQKVVIVESLYSMDGDICPLAEVADLCKKHNSLLIVDEAHAIGVRGENGAGLVQELNLEEKVTGRIITFGKASGIHGAAVVGPQWLKDYQTNFSRSLIFSTAPSPHQFASIKAMYELLPKINSHRKRLKNIVQYFLEKRKVHKGRWLPSHTHIQSLVVSGNKEVILLSKRLHESRIIALPIRKPSVPVGLERVRFCLHSFNTNEEIDVLFDALSSQ